MRAAKKNLRFPVVPVDCHHGMTSVPLLMLVPVKPTSLFQPFSECRAFHRVLFSRRIANGTMPYVDVDQFWTKIRLRN